MVHTFRPRTNFLWAGISFGLLGLFAANSIMVLTNTVQTLIELAFCASLASAAYLVWVKPKLVLNDEGIEVVNPFSTEQIAYGDVLELDTKWALTIIHTGGSTRVWVAPASGKRRWIADKTFGIYGRGVPLSQSGQGESETMSASLDSFSGQAAYLIRERMKRLH